MINIVLFQPEIPPNTGNIARLCVCNGFRLHLIHPLGFSLQKKELLRAGMDYWDQVDLVEYPSWKHFESGPAATHPGSLFFFSSKAKKSLWEVKYPKNPFLIFGSETQGLPFDIHQKFRASYLTIPMQSGSARCLNLSSSAAIAAYEVLRQESLLTF